MNNVWLYNMQLRRDQNWKSISLDVYFVVSILLEFKHHVNLNAMEIFTIIW